MTEKNGSLLTNILYYEPSIKFKSEDFDRVFRALKLLGITRKCKIYYHVLNIERIEFESEYDLMKFKLVF